MIPPNVTFAISKISDGNMSFKFGEHDAVVANRAKFLAGLGLELKNCVYAWVQAADETAVVNQADAGKGMSDFETALKVDAVITHTTGLGISFVVGDCLPLLIYDPDNSVIALVHLGWRGVDLRLAQKVVRLLQDKFDANPASLLALLGPGIRKESYHQIDPSQKNDPTWQPYLTDLANGGTAIDLPSFVVDQLQEVGVQPNMIEVSPIDTGSDPDYFSHYRAVRTGEPEGRFLIVAALKK